MKISANEIKVGNILEFENKLWKVLKLEHTKPGKGGAYIQIEIKDISYELNNINDFDLFNIKIVFESSDTTKISRIKNLRVIANTKT